MTFWKTFPMVLHCQLQHETSSSQPFPFLQMSELSYWCQFLFYFQVPHFCLNTTGRETFVIYTGNLQKKKKKSHCTVFINTDPKIFKTTKGDFGHQCVNVAIIQSWIPQSVVKPQPSKTVVHFITPREMTLALCFYNSLFEYLFLTPDWYLEN